MKAYYNANLQSGAVQQMFSAKHEFYIVWFHVGRRFVRYRKSNCRFVFPYHAPLGHKSHEP